MNFSKSLVGLLFILTCSVSPGAQKIIPKQIFNEQKSTKIINKLSLKDKVILDYKEFYATKNYFFLFSNFMISGVLANTQVDQNIADYYQMNVRSPSTDLLSSYVKPFGNRSTVYIYLGSFFVSYALKSLTQSHFIFRLSDKITRMLFVGTPFLLGTQMILGGSRPDVYKPHSRWNIFSNTNSVSASGHSFFGALPFLALSSLTDNIFLKSVLFLSSTLTAFSRINDNKHYLSQAFLGWSFAYLSFQVIEGVDSKFKINPFVSPDGVGVGLDYTF